ncbi:hypothetical protein NQ317_003876 [Molorchus minor]|uniref:Uncharacterized protein n=1 Tax=Molorchus minor TaxID=1323400 RepID=A0ABQ9JD54_9CUCU|nr:hypothetical protein NQ317_003876 [Molorchus minor]
MLRKELQINLDTLDEDLASLIPLMLVIYMKTWPGWQRSKEYFSGKLNFKEWYQKFRQYIVLRLNFLIKNGYNNVIEEIKQEKKEEMARLSPNRSFKEHGTQTDYLAPKGFAPFTIALDCPPSVLNSIVFTDSEDDIIIRQHPEMQWSKIDTNQLINWPYIEIEFFSPELSFVRKTCCDYNRYINFINTPLTYEKSDYIEQVEIIDSSHGRNCYTLNLLSCYIKEYLSVLRFGEYRFKIEIGKKINNFYRVSEIYEWREMKGREECMETRVVFGGGGVTVWDSEWQNRSDSFGWREYERVDKIDAGKIEVILGEFLKDVEEIDLNQTMATNTSVVFNIAHSSKLVAVQMWAIVKSLLRKWNWH